MWPSSGSAVLTDSSRTVVGEVIIHGASRRCTWRISGNRRPAGSSKVDACPDLRPWLAASTPGDLAPPPEATVVIFSNRETAPVVNEQAVPQ